MKHTRYGMRFEDFKRATMENPPADWRQGQTAFNGLCQVRPDLSAQIRGGILDPFHNDAVLPSFWTWVEESWEPKA